ncbi:MAG: hypothetical protein ACLT8E_08505 [Akkermansia sp.]
MDHRVVEELVDVELSIGIIFTNGAIAAVVVIDAGAPDSRCAGG